MQHGFMCKASSACSSNEASSLSISDIDFKSRTPVSASAAHPFIWLQLQYILKHG